MEKELTIKVKVDSEFEVHATSNLKHWNEATDEQRNEYIKEQVKEFLLEGIDYIVDDLIRDSKISY